MIRKVNNKKLKTQVIFDNQKHKLPITNKSTTKYKKQ